MEGEKSVPSDLEDEFDENDGDFVLVEAGQRGSLDSYLDKMLGDVTKWSAVKQLSIGGTVGWISGYTASKVGKTAAVSLTASLLLIQVAQHKGYININWTKVQRAMNEARAHARTQYIRRRQTYIDSAHRFYENNFFLASGFAGGFLLGFIL